MQVTDDMVRVAVEAAIATVWTASDDQPARETMMRAALEAALAAMWRPIEEAPRDGTRVLLCVPELTPPTIQAEWRAYDYPVEAGEWVDVWNDPIETNVGPVQPTLFMPLPSPPTREA